MKLNLDLSGVEIQESKTQFVPSGKYPATIVEAEMQETKTGGHGLKLYFKITSGEHAGSIVKNFMNIVNASPEAQKFALSDLKKIATYIGHKNPNHIADTDELMGGSVGVDIKEGTAQDKEGKEYKTSEVKGYFLVDANQAPTTNEKKAETKTETKKKQPWE